jgi:dTDP-4-amino-4,6-dideoxygalactose transaminase
MVIPFFSYQRQLKKINREIDRAIRRVLNSGKLILGQEVKNFEENFSKYIGAKYGVGVNSGTDALKIALRALGIKNGDEVIAVSNTAVPTVSAIREAGARPRLVDIKDDYTIDETKIAAAITKKTKAIVAVHLYGQPANLPAIMKTAKKYRLKVIEDCAQAHGAKIGGKNVGAFGDFGCFSFYPTKNLGAYGDGGMILTDNRNLAQTCRALRMYGMKDGYYSEIEGYNSRLDEMQAAILNFKLKYLNSWVKRRREIAKFYLKNIKNKKIILPAEIKNSLSAYHLFVIRTDSRNQLEKYLNACGIGYGIHYPQPIHLQTAYKFLDYKKGSLPLTEKYSGQIISLPIFPELTQKEIKYIVDKLNQWK